MKALFSITAFLALLLVVPAAIADDKAEAEARAKAALALAQAQRERELKPAPAPKVEPKAPEAPPETKKQHDCLENLEEARSAAKQAGKPLLILVGMTCDECPAIRTALKDDCVFCHVTTFPSGTGKRLIVPDKSGQLWGFAKADLDKGTLKLADVQRTLSGQWVYQCNGTSCRWVWAP